MGKKHASQYANFGSLPSTILSQEDTSFLSHEDMAVVKNNKDAKI